MIKKTYHFLLVYCPRIYAHAEFMLKPIYVAF